MPNPPLPRPTFQPVGPPPLPPTIKTPEQKADFELFGQPIDLPNDPLDALTKTLGTAVSLNPIGLGATVMSHTPTGWLPGGADDQFRANGERLQKDNPEKYREWLAVKVKSDQDLLDGGNQKGDFNNEVAEWYDSLSKDGNIGVMQPSSSGSLGGLLVHGGGGVLGFLANSVMRTVTERLSLPPETTVENVIDLLTQDGGLSGQLGVVAGKAVVDEKWRNAAIDAFAQISRGEAGRIPALKRAAELGATLSDEEQEALGNVRSGKWTEAHALDFLVRRGQSYTDDPWLEIAGSVVSDPLFYAGAVPGLLGKGAAAGRIISETRLPVSLTEKGLVSLAKWADHPLYGPVARLAGQVVNPHLPDSASSLAKFNLQTADGLTAFDRVYRHASTPLRQFGEKYGVLPKVERSIFDYVQHSATDAAGSEAQKLAVANHLGEELTDDGGAALEDIAKPLTTAMSGDAVDQYVETMSRIAHNVVSDGDIEQLALRLVRFTDGAMDVAEARRYVTAADRETRSALHAITHKSAEREFFTEVLPDVNLEALADEADIMPATLNRLTLMNTRTADETIVAQVLKDLGEEKNLTLAADLWNQAALRYPAIGRIGYASSKSQGQLNALMRDLQKAIAAREFPRRFDELDSPAAKPLADWLAQHTVEGEPLWRLGFLPEGPTLKRATSTGRYVVDRAPTIAREWSDAPVGFSRLRGHGLDTLDTYIRKLTDSTTSMQLSINRSKRFAALAETNLRLPERAANDIWNALGEYAGNARTTITGLTMGTDSPAWNIVKARMPEGHKLPNGNYASPRDIFDNVLVAAGGDMNVFGPLPVMTQRFRNQLRYLGIDKGNYVGWVTGTVFNKMRYANPIFLAQRLTDAPFFMALKGQLVTVGKIGTSDAARQTRDLMERVARTDWARAFAQDLPEFATRSNYVDVLSQVVVKAAGGEHKFASTMSKLSDAPDGYIANNMAKMVYSGMGKAVRDVLADRARLIGDVADPVLRKQMDEEIDMLERNFSDLRKLYSSQAGRVLDDNETGLRFILSHFDGLRKLRMKPDGSVDMDGFLHEIDQGMPADSGDIRPLYPEEFARSLGYDSSDALRVDMMKELERDATGRIVGGTDPAGLRELAVQAYPNAHPDYLDRVVDYFSGSWDDFRTQLIDESARVHLTEVEADRALGAIARIAEGRGMDPWEYLTGVVQHNLKAGHKNVTLVKHMQGLARALSPDGDVADLIRYFGEGHLDPSGQRVLLRRFIKSEEGKALGSQLAAKDVKPTLPEPWRASPYATNTEEVSVDELTKYMEIDREARGKGYTGLDYLDKLTEDIRKNGFEEPLEFAYDPETGLGLLSDGNHRLAVAKRLGLKTVPVYGLRVKGMDKVREARAQPITARIKPDADGNIPEHLTPTQVGLNPVTAPAWTPLAKPRPAPKGMYAHTVANGGGTFDAATGKEMGLTKGYGVGNGPLGKIVPNNKAAVDAAYREVSKTGAPNIGTWVNPDTGMVHVDPTEVVDDLDQALALARSRPKPEEAVFDYAGNKDIPLESELTVDAMMAKRFPESLIGRLQSGIPNDNPDVEAIFRAFKQWYQRAVQPGLDNPKITEMLGEMPTEGAAPFSRTEAMTASLLRDQLGALGNDAFFVAEMATKRSVLMRSINHPILGLYPPAYFWGKVMPLTLKLLARNPYGLTTDAIILQRQIAIQRALDPEFNEALDTFGSSELAYVLDYLTPGTPMGGYEVHGPRWMTDLMQGHWEQALDNLTRQINPLRTFTPFVRAGEEVVEGLQDIIGGPEGGTPEGYPERVPLPTPTSQLQTPLADAMEELMDVLG